VISAVFAVFLLTLGGSYEPFPRWGNFVWIAFKFPMLRDDTRSIHPNFDAYSLPLHPNVSKFVRVSKPKQDTARINHIPFQGVKHSIFLRIGECKIKGSGLVSANRILALLRPFHSDSEIRLLKIPSIENPKWDNANSWSGAVICDLHKNLKRPILAIRLETMPVAYGDVWTALSKANIPSYVSGPVGCARGVSCKQCGFDGSKHGDPANQNANSAP